MLLALLTAGIAGCAGTPVQEQGNVQGGGAALSGNSGTSGGAAASGVTATSGSVDPSGGPGSGTSVKPPANDFEGDDWEIRIIDADGNELRVYTYTELMRPVAPYEGPYTFYIYSTINNWPSARSYAASGSRVEFILDPWFETAQTVTFRAADGYEISLTREQILSPQYYYPHAGEGADGAKPVVPIIAWLWREGTEDMSEIREDKPLLIFGQRTPFEQTNPAFVAGVTEIILDTAPCEVWQAADTFPQAGSIEPGGTVKLQHPYFGLVKLHYTLDGSEPTMLSPMYNPSTYQTELNKPIPITEPTTIKVLVTGYGKNDSEIAVFEFWPEA